MTIHVAMPIVALLLLAGCTDGDDAPAAPEPTAAVVVDPDTGDVTAPGFNELIEASQPAWARDPLDAAAMLLGASTGEGPPPVATADVEGDAHVVTVVFEDLPDDSTAATRYVITFELADDGLLRFVSGTWGQRCQPGRGHQDFSVVPCT